MTIRLSTTKILSGVEATALTTHRTSNGTDHADVVTNTTELAQSERVKVAAVAIDTLNDEQSTAIGGSAANEYVPSKIVGHLEAVGGVAATGDAQITVGTSAGGTQILPATPLTGFKDLNDHFEIVISGLTDQITADSTLYVKCTTADTTAGAGHLADFYIVGEIVVSGT